MDSGGYRLTGQLWEPVLMVLQVPQVPLGTPVHSGRIWILVPKSCSVSLVIGSQGWTARLGLWAMS